MAKLIKGTFSVDVYDCSVTIILTDRVQHMINRYLKKDNAEEIPYEVDAFFFRPSDRIGKYFLFFDVNNCNVQLVNHEKSHLIDHILNDRSIRRKDETRAYLDGYLSKKIYSFFKRRKINLD